jgi:dTDP-4-dehydrorhamnose reductase
VTMRVLVTGAAGQVGQALRTCVPDDVEAHWTTHADLDIGDAAQVSSYVRKLAPDVVINAAAYTAVDRAESEEAAAVRINTQGPMHLAQACRQIEGARLIHISTDFVFDGTACLPYRPDHTIAPLGAYGRSKAGGEVAVTQTLDNRGLVVRTAWVYSAHGHNFMRTMLRLLRERGSVSVVDDQIGTPTAAGSLARVLWRCASLVEVSGIHHWTDAGVASWFDFATAIAEEGIAAGMLDAGVSVRAIDTQSYPTPAQRPKFSVLDKRSTVAALGIQPIHWRKQLRAVLLETSRA